MSDTHVALLRGINVGGRRMVAMGDLRDFLTQLGFGEPQTLLQSGNVIFRSEKLKGASLERLLEAEAKKRLTLDTAFFVRTAKEWRSIVAANPFPREATDDPGRLVVLFLRDAPSRTAVDAIHAAIAGPERVRVAGSHAYVVYPNGIGRSRLPNTILEKHLGRGTARNWNTMLKVRLALEARG